MARHSFPKSYQEADALLTGRCKESRKLANNTHLHRRSWGAGIAVKLHSTDVVTFLPDGSIELSTGGWSTPTTRDRMDAALPTPWHVASERGTTILYGQDWKAVCLIDYTATINPDGTVEGGGDVQEFRDLIRQADNERNRVRSRARYWTSKAREGKPARNLTVENILAEENVTVRVAKMSVYGMDRFLIDAKADILDQHGEYTLLSLALDQWQRVVALKMTCPSTQAVYVSPVPPHTDSVASALDWYFDCENYLEKVGQQA